MNNSLKKEILRKLFHLMEIPVILMYSYIHFVWGHRIGILALTALFLILLEVEHIRLEVRPKLPKILNILRPRERNNVTGTVFFISATIIAFSAFDYSIAILALLLTVFGDLASALIGIRFGKHKIIKNKTLEGCIAGFLINIVVGFLLLPEFPIVFISMAIVASLVELITNKLDDNLTVPVFSGFAGQIIVYFFAISLPKFPSAILYFFSFMPFIS